MSDVTHIFGGPLRLSKEPVLDSPNAQLYEAISRTGIIPPSSLKFDGQVHRFNNGKKKDKSAWYIAYDDGIAAGAFGDWREGINHTWRADIGRELTVAEQMANAKRMAEIKAIREQETQEKHSNAATTAQDIWSECSIAPDDHPYLINKRIDGADIRITADERLVIPIYINNEISSVQYINAGGFKKFLHGGAISGGYCALGDTYNAQRIFVCEGFATGKSIQAATDNLVFVAFSANNLIKVAAYIRGRFGITSDITIVADNDESGVGEREGRKAAESIHASFVMPPERGDANDYVNAGHDLAALLIPVKQRFTFNMLSFGEILLDTAPLKWIVKGIMPQDSLMMIHGPSGGGKSFIALDMAMAIATGQPSWCGHKVNRGVVAYLAGEGHHGIKQRLQAWAKHYDITEADFYLSDKGTDLNTPDGYKEVVEALQALPKPPTVIKIDTLHRFLAGDENSAQDAKTMIDACASLSRMFKSTVVLVHHTGVSEEAQHRARGSSAWRGALDAEMSVIPPKDGIIQLVQRKQKDAELGEDIFMRLERVEFGTVDEDGDPIGSAVVVQVNANEVSFTKDDELVKAQGVLMEIATASGSVVEDRLYVTNEGFTKWSKGRDWTSDDQRKKKVQRIKSKLTGAGILTQDDIGFVVSDMAIAGAIRVILSIRGGGR